MQSPSIDILAILFIYNKYNTNVYKNKKLNKMTEVTKIKINGIEVQVVKLEGFENVSPPLPDQFNWQKYDMPKLFQNSSAQEVAARIFEASFIAGEWVAINLSDLYNLAMQDAKTAPSYKTLVRLLGVSCLYDGLRFLLGESDDNDQHHLHPLYDECDEFDEIGFYDDLDNSLSEPVLEVIKVDKETFYGPTKELIKTAFKH